MRACLKVHFDGQTVFLLIQCLGPLCFLRPCRTGGKQMFDPDRAVRQQSFYHRLALGLWASLFSWYEFSHLLDIR